MTPHAKPFACGRCLACESSNAQACESPRGGCRCAECVEPPVDWQARAEVERLTKERDEAREELRLLREVRQRGCECSDSEACAFARERDETRKSLEVSEYALAVARDERAKVERLRARLAELMERR